MIARRLLLLLPFGFGALGCANDDDTLDDPENVRTWATTGSALSMYANGNGPISFADGQSTFSDPSCPFTSDDGTLVVISGPCSDASGTIWSGSATVERTGGDRVLTFSDYMEDSNPDGAKKNGTVELRQVDLGVHDFHVDMVIDGGIRTTLLYGGHVEGDYGTRTVWSGAGSVVRSGMLAPTGVAHITTTDEVVDNDVCAGQPLSGRTTITTSDQSAVVRYDGERDCDGDQNALYSVDGQERGKLSGISCTIAGAPGHAGGGAALLLVYVFAHGSLLTGRRRSRARPA